MIFKHRSYGGKLFRPKPEVSIDADKQLIIIATPWGERSAAKRSIEILKDHFYKSKLDDEHTMPFIESSIFSQNQSRLYNAIRICHKYLHDHANNEEYSTGVELTALALEENECSWVQVGQPNLFLARDSMSITPLSYQHDLSLEACTTNKIFPPLPQKFLGIGSHSQIYSNSFKIKTSDQIIFTSQSYLPKKFYQIRKKQTSLEGISQILSSFDSESPFWLGLLNL